MKRLLIARSFVTTALGFLALSTALTVLPSSVHASYHGPYMTWRSGTHYGGGSGYRYGGGYRYHYYPSYRYRYHSYPRSYVSFGFGFGTPYYYCRPYPVYVHRRTVYVEPSPTYAEPEIDVTNLPPAGCYYYDRFCDETFSSLDDYTDHIQEKDHDQTIEVVDKRSGNSVRTLEFVGGYWRVRQ